MAGPITSLFKTISLLPVRSKNTIEKKPIANGVYLRGNLSKWSPFIILTNDYSLVDMQKIGMISGGQIMKLDKNNKNSVTKE